MTPGLTPLRGLILAAFGAVVFWGALQARRATVAQREAAASALRADSLVAAADTTRLVAIRGLTKIYERRVIQERQVADSLDRLLRRERIARVGLVATVRALDTTLTGHVTADSLDNVRVAQWPPTYQPPFTIEARVELPRPPAEATLQIGVRVDPVRLGLRLGCGSAGRDGIRPASVAVEAPTWATIRLEQVSQSPDLCASPALQPKPKRRWPWLVAGVLVGMVGWEVIR
jgi:hypothetical protein